MSPGLRKTRKRFEIQGHARFLTFSTYRRLPLFNDSSLRDALAQRLGRARVRVGFGLIGWVVMPEHVHLLVLPRLPGAAVPRILNAVKGPLSRMALSAWRERDDPIIEALTDGRGVMRFWQAGGGYDRNVLAGGELLEKLQYIHFNPVKRGLVQRPEEWAWSSARWYAGQREGAIEVDSHLMGN